MPTNNAVILVSESLGEKPVTSIQVAIDDNGTSSGDTIFADAGDYVPSLVLLILIPADSASTF